MNLKEFIEETLTSIVDASHATQDKFNSSKIEIDVLRPRTSAGASHHDIEFDIAVTASNSEETKKGGGLKISVISAGIDGQKAHLNESVSRIKFKIPLYKRS